MRTLIFAAVVIALIGLVLLMTGCSAISTLEAVVDATEAAIPILQAAGAPIPPVVLTYVTDVGQCIAGQNGSTAPTDAQLLAVAGCLGSAVAPSLPPGVGSAIANIVSTIATDVSKFLAQHPPPTAAAKLARGGHPLSAKDAAKFSTLKTRAQVAVATLKAMRK